MIETYERGIGESARSRIGRQRCGCAALVASDLKMNAPSETRLNRALSLPMITIYGLGTMVGGGFYALLGKVAGHAGMLAPMSFLVAAAIAFVTALSFGELAARFPYSAGESRYVFEAFRRRSVSMLVGWMVIATGVVSAATLANAFSLFLRDLIVLPSNLGVVFLIVVLSAIAIWGIGQSVVIAGIIAVIEVGGLVYLLVSMRRQWSELPLRWKELVPTLEIEPWSGVFVGAFLAFYAYIGFEDMVNEGEEVIDPSRNLPRAILIALIVTAALYLLVATPAVLMVPPQELAEARTPLALLVPQDSDAARMMMVCISMLAGVNGALVQLIMASRVAYGMSDQGMGPAFLARVHLQTRTPITATLLIAALTLTFGLWLPLEALARLTSAIMLVNFAAVNLSLVVIKRRSPERTDDGPRHSIWVPIFGSLLCLIFLGLQCWNLVFGSMP